jgi:hypothetical protein
MEVEHTLHTAWGWTRGFARPPVPQVEQTPHTDIGERRDFALPALPVS